MRSIMFASGTIPIFRDLVSYSAGKLSKGEYGYSRNGIQLTPELSVLHSMLNTADAVFKDEPDWHDALKHGTEFGFYVGHAPLQFHTIIWNLVDYLNGDLPDLEWSEICKKHYTK